MLQVTSGGETGLQVERPRMKEGNLAIEKPRSPEKRLVGKEIAPVGEL